MRTLRGTVEDDDEEEGEEADCRRRPCRTRASGMM